MPLQFATGNDTQAYQDIREGTANFAIFQFAPNDKERLVAREKGSAPEGKEIATVREKLDSTQVQYAAIRLITGDELSRRAKYVLLTWVGENVSPFKRGAVSGNKGDIAALFPGINVEVYATEKGDIDEKEIMNKVVKAMGANYGTGGAAPSASSSRPAPSAASTSASTSVSSPPAPKPAPAPVAAPAPAPAPVAAPAPAPAPAPVRPPTPPREPSPPPRQPTPPPAREPTPPPAPAAEPEPAAAPAAAAEPEPEPAAESAPAEPVSAPTGGVPRRPPSPDSGDEW